jgi:16S rRNA (uracil1498-N3)-methyltransferase
VLRLRAGEVVTMSDGAGSWRPGIWSGSGVEVTGDVVCEVEWRPTPSITVAFAPTKGDRPEWVVQKLTELGVDRIVAVRTDRSVVRWEGERAARQVERLRAVTREAAMQSRQVWLPVVEVVATLSSLEAGDGGLALAEPGGAAPSLDRAVVAVGPEGGWSEAELAAGHPIVGLGPTVLRAETAAVVAGSLLCALRSSLLRPA